MWKASLFLKSLESDWMHLTVCLQRSFEIKKEINWYIWNIIISTKLNKHLQTVYNNYILPSKDVVDIFIVFKKRTKLIFKISMLLVLPRHSVYSYINIGRRYTIYCLVHILKATPFYYAFWKTEQIFLFRLIIKCLTKCRVKRKTILHSWAITIYIPWDKRWKNWHFKKIWLLCGNVSSPLKAAYKYIYLSFKSSNLKVHEK